MCTYSMIVDHYREKWTPLVPAPTPIFYPSPVVVQPPQISQAELDEFRRLLQRAREYDRRNNQPDCDLEEKKAALRTLAQQLGVDISFVDETGEPPAVDAVDPVGEKGQEGPTRVKNSSSSDGLPSAPVTGEKGNADVHEG